MVWKKMLVEQIQDGFLVYGHLWYVNMVIVTILSLYVVWGIPSSFCSKEYMGWKRCCLKNNKVAVKILVIFDFWTEWFYLFWASMLHDAFHQVSAQENIWVGRSCLKKFQEGCLVHDHLWYLSGMKEAFLSPCLAWPIQSKFCSIEHRV